MPDLDRFRFRWATLIAGGHHASTTTDGRTPVSPAGTLTMSAMPSAPAGSRRGHLSVPMLRVLGADCGVCRGVGCLSCEHSGLR